MNTKVTFKKTNHKRFSLLIPNAKLNCIPYPLISTYMGSFHIIHSHKSSASLKLYCNSNLTTVAAKIKYARLSCGKLQQDLADHLQIDKSTYLRYENGQVSEQNIKVATLKKIATYCGQGYDFCFAPYHYFIETNAGLQIKKYRKSHNLTQSQFGALLGVVAKTVRYWEHGICSPSLECFNLVSQ